jgi:drug/metabolite transporter (DMT)-like permease
VEILQDEAANMIYSVMPMRCRGAKKISRMCGVAPRPGREVDPVRIAIAVVAALCAAFCFAVGSLVQQGAARQTHARALRFGLLVALVHQRRWLGGMAVTVLAFGIQAAALAFGPLALVQPLVATEVLFALPMIAHRNRLPLRRKGIIGGLGVVSGLAVFVAVSPPAGGVSVPGLAAWAPALAGIAALTVLSASVGLRRRGTARVIWLAAATAVIYALVNAVTKSSVGLLMHRGAGVLATWEPYALMAAGILGGLFGQSAFNAGPLSLSLPVIDTVEPVSSVILGAAVFGERLARSPGLLAFQLVGGAIAAAGITVLSRSPVTLAEERRESRSASPQVVQAPEPADRLVGNKHHGSF